MKLLLLAGSRNKVDGEFESHQDSTLPQSLGPGWRTLAAETYSLFQILSFNRAINQQALNHWSYIERSWDSTRAQTPKHPGHATARNMPRAMLVSENELNPRIRNSLCVMMSMLTVS